MPFRKLHFQRNFLYFAPSLRSVSPDENSGVCHDVEVSVNGNCPPPEEFKLDVLLKAGVPLDKVPTTLFKSSVADVQALSDAIDSDFEKLKASAAPAAPAASAVGVSNA